MQLLPATAARWRSLAAIEALRASGVDLRNCVLARRDARRRIGVRFIGAPLRVVRTSCETSGGFTGAHRTGLPHVALR